MAVNTFAVSGVTPLQPLMGNGGVISALGLEAAPQQALTAAPPAPSPILPSLNGGMG